MNETVWVDIITAIFVGVVNVMTLVFTYLRDRRSAARQAEIKREVLEVKAVATTIAHDMPANGKTVPGTPGSSKGWSGVD